MITICFHPEQKFFSVLITADSACAQAVLLTLGGAEAERFLLQTGANRLQLDEHPPGTYSLRIECEKEVVVRQIMI